MGSLWYCYSGWCWCRCCDRHSCRDNIKKAQAFDDAIDQADSKIRRTVKRNSKTRFWEAFTNGRYVSIGRGLTFNQAVNNVKKGKHVFAVTKLEAESVA